MYQTNSTNSMNSAIQAKSFANLQRDFWDTDDQAHNPDAQVISQVFKHYHQALGKYPGVTNMLIRRKIDPCYIERFHIGLSDRTLGYELQSPKCLLGSRNRGHLQRLGLLRASGHEFFRGAVVIPYCNDEGQIMGAYGRRPRHQRRTPAYHLYWNAQQVPLFNSANVTLPESLILCKSAIDALTLLSAGIENVAATMGIKGFNDIQLTQLLEHRVQRVYIAFDNTPAADRYALLVAQALDAIDIACFRVKLPVGQDVNRFALGQKGVADSFNQLVKAAAPFKQRYGELAPNVKDQWLKQLVTIEDCVAFYLEEQRHAEKAYRTLNASRIHLDRFLEYCQTHGVEQVSALSNQVLDAYQRYLSTEKSTFTGQLISPVTRGERVDTVARMLARLYYYGLIREPLVFSTPNGSLH